MGPILRKWLFVLFIALPLIIYFLNLDIEALIHREIHGRRGAIYYFGHNMFWLQFLMNIFYAFMLAFFSVQIVSEKKEEPDKK